MPYSYTDNLQVNWTPYFLEDILKLRDTWLALTIILATVFLVILLLLIFLRQVSVLLPGSGDNNLVCVAENIHCNSSHTAGI